MADPGDGEVMAAQLHKKTAGWGEQGSLTCNLERQKAEQRGAREEIRGQRMAGTNVDGGAMSRIEDQGVDQVMPP